MFIRLTFFDFQPGQLENVKRIFNEEIVPIVKTQKGNMGVWLLEPTDKNDQYISLTEWTTESDANLYQSSGVYKNLVDKIKDLYRRKPILRTYSVESRIAAAL